MDSIELSWRALFFEVNLVQLISVCTVTFTEKMTAVKLGKSDGKTFHRRIPTTIWLYSELWKGEYKSNFESREEIN